RFERPAARERLDQFIAAREAWRAAQRAHTESLTPDIEQTQRSATSAADRDQLEQAHAAFVRARDAIRQHDDPEFLSPARSIVDISRAVRAPGEALVYLIADNATGYAFVLTRDNAGKEQIRRVDLPDLTTDAVNALLLGLGNANQFPSDGLLYAQMGWAAFYLPSWGTTPRAALHALPGTSEFALALRQTLDTLSDKSMADIPFTGMTAVERAVLDAHFVNNLLNLELQRALETLGDLGLTTMAHDLHQMGIHALAIVPYGRLAMLPLPGVLIGQAQRLGEIFDITLTPAARTLEVARDRMQALDATHQTILAAGNPWPLAWDGGNLAYAEAEADTIKRTAERYQLSRPVLKYTRDQVSRDHVLAGLNHAWYAHLALHGSFDPTNPRRSRIILRGTAEMPENERVITLQECLDGTIDLKGMRLLVLSACETAVIQADQSANEMIGLAPAFAQAGAEAVIAALWPVNDHATYLLMARFANLFLDPRRDWSPSRCLAQAQRWLREEATNALLASNDFDPTAPIPLPA
ncbi:MAG TPA: CHAT domain-containing protein, partial [Ktedonobacterales bacterium]|nr:CHAT domain-containing protein [Ktedonobacterales bacterium]